jgi:UDP-glucoronosyl and UDP-glucosyl transferase
MACTCASSRPSNQLATTSKSPALRLRNKRRADDDFFDQAVRAEVALIASRGGSFLPPVLERGLCPVPVNSPLQAGARTLVGATIHRVADLEDARTLVTGVLPNHLVMPRVAAAVIMGGQGTTQTAMTSGVPFVGLPYHGEQELSVALAERQGMAIRLSPRHAGSPRLTEAVRRLLDDPGARARAKDVARVYARYDGPSLAAEAIEAWLGAGAATAQDRRLAS